ncbi:putative manganese efflux pump MntP 2 [Clostridia bacterium]|nr:putative manganese efflux pump MntP 2 [Clostridia bacterium]
MELLTVFVIAVGLAMDAFAVSSANGAAAKSVKLSQGLKFGAYFGGFQFVMPVAGYYFGSLFSKYIDAYAHWISFGILLVIGGKMIYETFGTEEHSDSAVSTKQMLTLAFATSIDALTVGISFSLSHSPIWVPSVIIGVVAFAFSFCGVFIGKKAGALIGKNAERVGGAALIIIAVTILVRKFL